MLMNLPIQEIFNLNKFLISLFETFFQLLSLIIFVETVYRHVLMGFIKQFYIFFNLDFLEW